jgi:predicted MFS family arabinose efflux permease
MFGKRRVLIAVLFVVSGGTLLCVFWLQIPAFLIAMVLVYRYVPPSPVASRSRVDWAGAGLLSAGMIVALVTVTQAPQWGVLSAATLVGVLLALAFLVAWVRSAGRPEAPLIDLALLTAPALRTVNVAAFLIGIAQFAGFILIPQYVQEPQATGYGLGASPLRSGVYLISMTLAVLGAGVAVVELERRKGIRVVLVSGSVSLIAAFLVLTVDRGGPGQLYLASGLVGLGTGLGLPALAAITVARAPALQTGVASGINSVARTLGGAVGGQVAAAALAASVTNSGRPSPSGFDAAFAVGLVAAVAAMVASVFTRPTDAFPLIMADRQIGAAR